MFQLLHLLSHCINSASVERMSMLTAGPTERNP